MSRMSLCPLRTRWPLPALVLYLASAATSAAIAQWTIAVDPGPFPSVQAAASAQSQVNWLDANQADDEACTQCFAAVELQRYLRRMTGRSNDFTIAPAAQLPPSGNVILVGRPSQPSTTALVSALGVAKNQLAALGPEGYCIKSAMVQGRRAVLVAGSQRVGTLYAAYDLLYRLGCRWFAPGELGEDVPSIETIPDLDVRQRPSFLSRGFLAWENRGDPDFLLWMARNRLDYWTLAQQPHALMHKLGIRMVCGLHDAENQFLGPQNPYPYDHPRFTGDEARPRDPYPVSPEYQGDTNGDGRLSYFEAHPEWYPLVKGKRVPGIRDESFGTNFCTSNPHASAEFVKNYVHALVAGPYRDADIVRFWMLDAGKWCECQACQAQGTPTDRHLLLVHRFCQEIDKARQDGRLHRPLDVTFLAYADVVDPPTRPLPAGFPPAYCMATFYPIRRCYVHRLDDSTCAANDKYYRQLAGWSRDPQRLYRGQLAIGEYYNVSVFKCLPICFMHTMAHDIPNYYKSGARHFDYMHVTTQRWGNKALTNYQMARQLWDVTTDCEPLWTDYFARRYGPAAAPMRRFYESLERAFSNCTELKYSLARRLDRGEKDLFPGPHLRCRPEPGVKSEGPTLLEIVEHAHRCRQCLAEALALPLPAPVKARISDDEQCFTYGQRTVAYYQACAEAFQEARTGNRDSARRHYAEAQRLAELLRADTLSARGSSSHASADDAFTASLATHALQRLEKLLETTH